MYVYTGHLTSCTNIVPTFKIYLFQISEIRTTHKQIICLLTAAEQNDLNTKDVFNPFKGNSNCWRLFQFSLLRLKTNIAELELLSNTSHSNQKWTIAKKECELLLQPAEHRVALKLRKQLSAFHSNIRQVVIAGFIIIEMCMSFMFSYYTNMVATSNL